MIEIGSWAPRAEEKLQKEKKDVSGQKEKVMADAVYAQIRDFCMQDEEFAQAVVQGGSFADCMKAVAKNVGNYISDVDAYQKAVGFYFPGAKIRLQMTIDLIGKAATPVPAQVAAPEKKPVLTLNLADFF
jgi:hypothetical protein